MGSANYLCSPNFRWTAGREHPWGRGGGQGRRRLCVRPADRAVSEAAWRSPGHREPQQDATDPDRRLDPGDGELVDRGPVTLAGGYSIILHVMLDFVVRTCLGIW